MRVLYGDDKNTWHKLFDKVLSLRGIEVVHAYTPKEVINLTVEKKPDVAILDVTLSHGKAYDVIKRVKERGVPVVVIGHKAEGFDREKALSLGAFEAIEKPFTVEQLLNVLRELRTQKPELKEELELVAPVEPGEFLGVTEPATLELQPEELPVEHVETVEVEEPKEELLELEPIQPQEEVPQTVPVESEVVEEAKKRVEEAAPGAVSGLPEEKVEQIIREIAWEVIPEIAEKVIREEVEKLIKSRLA